jgi:polyphosphate kinase 2
MKKVLSEINRYRELLGLTLLEDVKPADEYENEIAEILKKENVYTKEVEELLYNVLDMGFNETINFDLLERNVRNVLMKKGDKNKNVTKYFENIIKALKKRKKEDFTSNEPDFEEFSFEPEEPSLIKKKVYRDELYHLQVELLKMQEWVKKTGKTVIIVFEGRDSAGKGSTIKKFTENLNPRYYNIIALGIPTPEERKAWWDRYRNQIQKGMINFFDRSWYNRGLVEPVMGYGSAEEYEDFMENVEGFEQDLVKDGDYLFKLWFSIDKETQANRFQMRQQSPLKYWKYSPNDEKMQDMWERFTEFKQKLFDKTSTVNHPWVILDANDKRVSGLNAIRYVLQNIPYEGKNKEVLNKEFPEAMTILKPEVNEQMGGPISGLYQSQQLADNPPIKQTSSQKKEVPNLSANELTVYNFLMDNGFSKSGAAAMMGNIKRETTFLDKNIKEKATEDNGAPSFGIIQWRGERFLPNRAVDVFFTNDKTPNIKTNCKDTTNHSRLKSLMCNNPNTFNSINTQLNFMLKELQKYPSLLKSLEGTVNSIKGVGDRALEVNRIFIGGDPESRDKFAIEYFNKIKDEKYL